jgi:hypothetical protein
MRTKLFKIAQAATLGFAMTFTFSCSAPDDGEGGGGGLSAYYGWYGNGSATNYTISTAAQLRGLADIVRGVDGDNIPPQDDFRGKTITLDADIAGGEWRSIGYSYYPRVSPFNGTFDGNNKTISSLHTDNQGVFGLIGEYGTVKNIVFTDFSLDGSDGAGGLARINEGAVQNVGINGNITGGGLGGGLVYSNKGRVENSYFSGNVTGGGGIVHSNSGTVRNSYSTGSVSGGHDAGGVVGSNWGTVQNSYSTSNVTSCSTRCGGVVGSNEGTVQNSYATGSVSSNGAAGGVEGGYGGTIRNCVALNPSVNSGNYNSGKSYHSSGRVSSVNSSLNNNYGLKEMAMHSGYTIAPNVNGRDGADVTSTEYNDANWWQNTVEFSSDVWEFSAGLPILKNMPTGTQNPVVAR